MTRSWQDDDPGLPIDFGPVSNGEYYPLPLSPVVLEATRQARMECEDNARLTGMSRRQFLLSASAMATMLLALDACTKDEARSRGTTPGGSFNIPPEATKDPAAAQPAIGGKEFIFDVQGHFLDTDVNPGAAAAAAGLAQQFPQGGCGETDRKTCFSRDTFLELMFAKSDTSTAVISALPIAPESTPLPIEAMEQTARLATELCHDQRVLLHAQGIPNVGSLQAQLANMERVVREHKVAAWKVYTNYPDFSTRRGDGWWLDDHEPGVAQVGNAFIDKAVALGVPRICVHKGFSFGSRFASPEDIGGAAKNHPRASFIVYHSGYESGQPEGPYTDEVANVGVNRLITSLRKNGIGPNQNVYAELGSTWFNVMRRPTEAAHVLGKLLQEVGEDNVVWGTDSIWYGSPQPQIQAFRAFEISAELQEKHGYPALTPERKAKIFGLNSARLYGIDPKTVPCTFTREDIEKIRQQAPGSTRALGPRTLADVHRLIAHHGGWP